jgi:hypothetical protein
MEQIRKKFFVGSGQEAAAKARLAGASKATCSRIRTGKQNFFFSRYHDLLRNKNKIPYEKDEFYRLIHMGIRSVAPEINQFDLDDIAQECAYRLIGLNSWGNNPNAVCITWAKRITKQFIKVRSYSRSHFLSLNLIADPQWKASHEQFKYFYESEWENKTTAELQDVLNAVGPDDDDELYHRFRWMRKRQCAGACEKCGSVEAWTLHHIIPRRIRVENTIKNTAGLCETCHNTVEVWYSIAEAINFTDYQKIFRIFMKSSAADFTEVAAILKTAKERFNSKPRASAVIETSSI